MSETGFLNIEYILLKTWEYFGSVHPGEVWAELPSWTTFLLGQVAIWGMVITLLLVMLIVYTQIRLLKVEHEGFHGKEEHHVHAQEEALHTPPQSERWRRVMELASSPNPSDWRRAILEADIMLSVVLREAGYDGDSVGEQLKMANPFQMTTLDVAWKAHKVRNEVAHGGEAYALTERDTRAAIDYYRRVFEEFGAI